MPIYRVWLCTQQEVSHGWCRGYGSLGGDLSFIVKGYVNRVVFHIENDGGPSIVVARVNEKTVLNKTCLPPGLCSVGNEHSADITQHFRPRRTEDGECADRFEILIGNGSITPATYHVTAWLDIDVTGTIIETSGAKLTAEESLIGGIVDVFVQLMFLMMVMNLLMGMMSMFMEVFV